MQVRETGTNRFYQSQGQQLRSRQRANYQVLVSGLPLYRQTLEGVVQLIAQTMDTLQTPAALPLTQHIK